jgi:predicted dehydrogenase
MAVDAMLKSKHVAVEVPAAITIDGCWQLVETSEKMQKHCTMLENCNYDRIEMMILNMVNLGIFGELIHAQCGYLHDLRSVKFSDQGEGLWRREHSKTRDGDLYPTHGLGPVAQCLNINRGNYFKYIVSMSSKSRGLQLFAEEHFGPESQEAREKFKLGDVVVTLMKTYNGETVVLTHDTNLPRPYSRDIFIQGTKGIIRKYPEPRIHLQDSSPAHQWESINSYLQKYDHPLWKKMQTNLAEAAGHGGMDYLEDYRLIQAYHQGVEPDMNVYDAAMLSAVSELSETSVAKRGMPQRFPDFTRGMWQNSRKLPVMKI